MNESILQQIKELQTSIKSHTDATHRTTLIVIIIVFAASLILVSLLMTFVILSIGKSIRNFNETLQKLSQGDMTVKAEVDRGDEFDEFGLALNHMTEKMSTVLSAVNRIAVDVNQSGSNLESVAKGTDENSSVIGNSIHDIVTGANDQAKDVEDSTLQMYKMGELMDTIIENASELDETSDHMEAASADVKEILRKLSESNNHMNVGVGQISDLIRETNESVEQISDAANLISSIAEETNLLSLNASIEAARAGEHGKGFAVVAGEIRELAEHSQEAVVAIQEVTGQVIVAVNNLAENSEKTVHFIDDNVMKDYQRMVDIGEQYSSDADRMRSLVETIDQATKTLRKNAEDVSNSINEISVANNEGASGITTISQNTVDILQMSDDVTDIMDAVQDNTEKLKGSVNQLTI